MAKQSSGRFLSSAVLNIDEPGAGIIPILSQQPWRPRSVPSRQLQAQLAAPEVTNKPNSDNSAVRRVMNEAGCGQKAAKRFLARAGGNVDRAIDLACGCGTSYLPRPSNNDDDEWDFILPRVHDGKTPELGDGADSDNGSSWGLITPSSSYSKLGPGGDDELDLTKLVGDIQAGQGCDEIRSRLTRYREHMKPDKLREGLNGLVLGFPGFFYVVETRNVELVRMWAEYGGDVNVTYGSIKPLPLIAYVIALGSSYATDTTGILRTLLGLGASVAGIPKAFHTPLERDIPDDGPSNDELGDLREKEKQWCTPRVRKRITATLNSRFEQRYILHRAALLNRFSGGKRDVAKYYKAEDLLGIHFYLVGQTAAITFVVDHLISYFALQAQKPLVLLFAGPSGHGKTEFARNLGNLTSLDLEMVDCTSMRYKTDLWGPFNPFYGWEKGSALSNFLEEHTSQRCIAFLDEFEKTDKEVRESLLKPFEEGIVRSRKNHQWTDCRQTIWILATNVFDDIIHDFCKRHAKVLFSDEPGKKGQKLIRQLSKMIQKASISKFGAPLSGRISEFVPFLTFSHCEQAAVADRFLASFGSEVIKPVKESTVPNQARKVGNLDVQVRRSYSVCRALVTDGYTPELGARSIANAVSRDISVPVVNEYLDRRERIHENQGKCRFVVGVDKDGMIDVSESPSDGTSGSS